MLISTKAEIVGFTELYYRGTNVLKVKCSSETGECLRIERQVLYSVLKGFDGVVNSLKQYEMQKKQELCTRVLNIVKSKFMIFNRVNNYEENTKKIESHMNFLSDRNLKIKSFKVIQMKSIQKEPQKTTFPQVKQIPIFSNSIERVIKDKLLGLRSRMTDLISLNSSPSSLKKSPISLKRKRRAETERSKEVSFSPIRSENDESIGKSKMWTKMKGMPINIKNVMLRNCMQRNDLLKNFRKLS